MFDFITTQGLIFLIFGWGFVLFLLIYSVSKILKSEKNIK